MTTIRMAGGTVLVLMALATAPAVSACNTRQPTPAASLGPHDFSTPAQTNELWREGDGGEPLVLSLRVLDTCGKPISGARIQLLHSDQDGNHHPRRWRALLTADAQGAVDLITVVPGYAGGMARHIHFIISHPAYAELITRLYFKNDPAVSGLAMEPLTLVPEEIREHEKKRWVAGYEFVLGPEKQ